MKSLFNSKSNRIKKTITVCFVFCLPIIFFSCNNKTESLTEEQSVGVKDSVQKMMDLTAKDISTDGPIAWLKHFEDTPDFFMASEGQLVFANNDSAKTFIKNILVKKIHKIELRWNNIRIDPLTNRFANVAANWQEDMTDFSDNKISQSGYFTGIAEKTSSGWQLRNAHWSAVKPK